MRNRLTITMSCSRPREAASALQASSETNFGGERVRTCCRLVVGKPTPERTCDQAVNFLSEDGVEAFERAYGPVTRDRLRRLSERYDPEMVFCAASQFSARA